LWYSLLKWSVVSNMTRSLMYDASSLGNHEFDDGVGDLAKFATEVKPVYPLLACNLVNELYFFPWKGWAFYCVWVTDKMRPTSTFHKLWQKISKSFSFKSVSWCDIRVAVADWSWLQARNLRVRSQTRPPKPKVHQSFFTLWGYI